MKRYFFSHILLFLVLSTDCLAQSPLPEEAVKCAFSQNYILWRKIRDRTWESQPCDWDSIPDGAYFDLLQLNKVEISGFVGLSFYHITKYSNELVVDGGRTISICTDGVSGKGEEQHFLLGITDSGDIKFVSGDMILNEVHWYLKKSRDYDSVAKLRLFFLLPENIVFVKMRKEIIIYSAYSRLLGKKVIIEVSRKNVDRFTILVQGCKNDPIMEVNEDWSTRHRQLLF